jgi:cytochrome P450
MVFSGIGDLSVHVDRNSALDTAASGFAAAPPRKTENVLFIWRCQRIQWSGGHCRRDCTLRQSALQIPAARATAKPICHDVLWIKNRFRWNREETVEISEASPIIEGNRDERKSARLAERNGGPGPGFRVVGQFALARSILRSSTAKQAGAGAEYVDVGNPEHVPLFFLDGEVHRRRRAAIAPFFTPKAITTRYYKVMEDTTDRLLAQLRRDGEGRLDLISFELAVAVAAEIVGLTESNPSRMAARISALPAASFRHGRGIRQLFNQFRRVWLAYRFYRADVQPAVKARRRQRGDDVISQTIDKGYSGRAILIECMTFASAGMVTTREFIVMAAWHLFEKPELKARFLSAGEKGQLAILLEILRLEPIAAMIFRRVEEDVLPAGEEPIKAGTRVAFDLRALNSDEAVAGACPFRLDPGRAARQNDNGTFMSFGDGAHYCPGWQVALHETRIFIGRLMRLPGIHLKRAPDMTWNAPLMSYELRNAVIACDKGAEEPYLDLATS